MQAKKTDNLENLRNFSVRLRAAIERKNATLQQVATHCGVAVSTVGAWTQGKNWPSVELLPKLAEFLGVNLQFLITGIPTEYPESSAEFTGKAEEPPAPYRVETSEKKPGQPPIQRHMMLSPGFAVKPTAPSREQCLDYINEYLKHAEDSAGGIGYAWVKLQKHFPLDDFHSEKK